MRWDDIFSAGAAEVSARRTAAELNAIRARLDAIEAVLKPPVPVPYDMPEATREALNKAVTSLWFGDSSDYKRDLWAIVRLLWPGAVTEDRVTDINALYRTLNPEE